MSPGGVRIFVCSAPVDLRHGFDRLAQTARERMGADPTTGGALFVFANKRATRLNARLTDAEERSAKLERERERDEYKKLALLLQEQVERLKLGLLGQKAERLPKNDAQLSLAILNLALGGDALATPPAEPEPESEQTIPAHQRRKPVRKPLPDTLPRRDRNLAA